MWPTPFNEVLGRHFFPLFHSWSGVFHPKQWHSITCVYKFKECYHPHGISQGGTAGHQKTTIQQHQLYNTTIKQPVFLATKKHQYHTNNNIHNIGKPMQKKNSFYTSHTKKLPGKRVVQWQTKGTAQRSPCNALPSSIPFILHVLRLMTDTQPPGQQKSPETETTTYIISSSTFTTRSLIIIYINIIIIIIIIIIKYYDYT